MLVELLVTQMFCDMNMLFHEMLTKYVVGAKANPPKNPSKPPKKGIVIPMNMVNATEIEKQH